MTALAANRETLSKTSPDTCEYGVAASATIYKGAMVCVDTAGYARAAANTAGYRYVGIALDKAVGTTTAGVTRVKVSRDRFLVAKGTAVIGDVGDLVYVSDDQTVATSTSNRVLVGRAENLESSSELWVLPEFTPTAQGEFAFGTSVFVGSLGAIDSGLRRNLTGVNVTQNETGTDGLVLAVALDANSAGLFTLEAYKMVVASAGVFYAATNTVAVAWTAFGA